MSSIDFIAPDTCARFMDSDAFARFIMGPVGSGKTTAAIFELLKRSAQQAPGVDGVRRTRWAIVRQTLQQLRMTVLLDILTWLRPIAHYKVSDQLITIRVNDIYSEWFLIPLEDPEDQRRLLSMQLTGSLAFRGHRDIPRPGRRHRRPLRAISHRLPRAVPPGSASSATPTLRPKAPTGTNCSRTTSRPTGRSSGSPEGLSEDAENLDYLMQTPETLKLPLGDPRTSRPGPDLLRASGPRQKRRLDQAVRPCRVR